LGDGTMALRDAEHVALRTFVQLPSLPLPAAEVATIREFLDNAIRGIAALHPRWPGEEGQPGIPHPGWGTARLRVVPLTDEATPRRRAGLPLRL
jgi:hypothetical protein